MPDNPMTDERWNYLISNQDALLTEEEVTAGWHFCIEWDGLLIGPGMDEMDCCHCEGVTHA